MRIVVHIGLHKTGTTYLQHQLASRRAELARQGWLFPKTGFMEKHLESARHDATPGHQGIVRAAIHPNFGLARRRLVAEIAESNCSSVLISCENFIDPFANGSERRLRAEKAAAFFRKLGDAEIVAVMREPHSYLEALYRERVMSLSVRESLSAAQFSELNFRNAVNFRTMLEPWNEEFNGRLRLLSYEELIGEGDYLAGFSSRLGFDLSHENAASVYSSPRREVIEVLRLANAFGSSLEGHVTATKSLVSYAKRMTKLETAPSSALHPVMQDRIIDYARMTSAAFLADLDCHFDWNAMKNKVNQSIASTGSSSALLLPELLETYLFQHTLSQSVASGNSWPKRLASRVMHTVMSNATTRTVAASMYRLMPEGLRRVARRFANL
ncbi:MAG: hypothetical protein H6873_04560 [Hyphomicrobiaceae bacterium]|nr:hypothetical protein [Hyphomicrobiaceae bacterium]